MAAIEVDSPKVEGARYDVMYAPPKSLLSCMSVIHDAGVDPDTAKTAESRKATSGVARRARRLRKQYRKRLNALDNTLKLFDYPLTSLANTTKDPYAPWNARIRLVEEYITDEQERKALISLALRHIARHRGWRNPYQKVSALYEHANKPSEHYNRLVLELATARKTTQDIELTFITDKDAKNKRLQELNAEIKQELGYTRENQLDKDGTVRVNEKTNEPYWKEVPPTSFAGTPAQLMQPFLNNLHQIRSHKGQGDADEGAKLINHDKDGVVSNTLEIISANMGKLHQSDLLYEVLQIFKTQNVPESDWKALIEGNALQKVERNGKMWTNTIGGVFSAVNPRDVGAAADLVAKDELPGQGNYYRATKASITFQMYRIAATVVNLRIGENKFNARELTRNEIHAVIYGRTLHDGKEMHGLFNLTTKEQDDVTWEYVAELLDIDRTHLQGVGGSIMRIKRDEDGNPMLKPNPKHEKDYEWEPTDESVSAKTPPVITTLNKILGAEGAKNELKPLIDWWEWLDGQENVDFRGTAKERFIETIGNAGRTTPMNDLEREADAKIDTLISEQLDEAGLQKLEKLGQSLASGRASYSVDSLRKLTKCMLKDGVDLHEARGIVFFSTKDPETGEITVDNKANDRFKPTPAPLEEQTGSPAVDRTLKIIARWVKACEKRWGKPQTINIEHVREGFGSVKQSREIKGEQTKRYNQNVKSVQAAIDNMGDKLGYNGSAETVRSGDRRRIQAIQRQNGQCAYCGKGISFANSQMDHIVPQRGVGSTSKMENLVATCDTCNLNKGKTPFALWVKSQGFDLKSVIDRINKEWVKDAWMNASQWKKYKTAVGSRLKIKDFDEPEDNRAIESVAWMAREVRERLEGHFNYQMNDLRDDDLKQRVYVFKGTVTSEARKVTGINGMLHWLGGASAKIRLDRRHHAVDAAVIAMMTPGVATVLAQKSSLRAKQFDTIIRLQDDITVSLEYAQTDDNGNRITEKTYKSGVRMPIIHPEFLQHAKATGQYPQERDKAGNIIEEPFWKDFYGSDLDENGLHTNTIGTQNFRNWLDRQMNVNHGEAGLVKLLNDGFDDGSVLVIRQLRLKLGNGSAHDDTVGKMKLKPLGDAWTYDEVNRVASKELYLALIEHEDYTEGERPWKLKDSDVVLEENPERRIHVAVKGKFKTFEARDTLGVMKGGLNMDGSPLPMRGGYVAQGSAIHHARYYKFPNLLVDGTINAKKPWLYGHLRVYKSDLLRSYGKKQDLFSCELSQESYSMRYAEQKLRYTLLEGKAQFLGYIVMEDEMQIDISKFINDDSAIGKFLRAFNETITKNGRTYNIVVDRFACVGFESNSAIKLAPIGIANEGFEELPKENELPRLEDGRLDGDKIGRIRHNFELQFNNLSRVNENGDPDNSGKFVEWENKDKLVLTNDSASDIANINTVIRGFPGSWHPSIDVLLSTNPKIIRRTTLGEERWHKPKSGNLPISWSIESLK